MVLPILVEGTWLYSSKSFLQASASDVICQGLMGLAIWSWEHAKEPGLNQLEGLGTYEIKNMVMNQIIQKQW